MPPALKPNLVMELDDTEIPCDPCKPGCTDKHYVVCRPKDYNKRTKKLKHGVKILLFTIRATEDPDFARVVLHEAQTFQFTK
jgi:hypothetical protein